jgi:hypothetical protein
MRLGQEVQEVLRPELSPGDERQRLEKQSTAMPAGSSGDAKPSRLRVLPERDRQMRHREGFGAVRLSAPTANIYMNFAFSVGANAAPTQGWWLALRQALPAATGRRAFVLSAFHPTSRGAKESLSAARFGDFAELRTRHRMRPRLDHRRLASKPWSVPITRVRRWQPGRIWETILIAAGALRFAPPYSFQIAGRTRAMISRRPGPPRCLLQVNDRPIQSIPIRGPVAPRS